MSIAPVYELTVYDDDDTTVLFAVGTATGHAKPYLKVPEGFPEREVSFAKGAVSIGQMSVEIVDVAQTAGNQATGYITGLLADSAGYSQVNGHRAVLTRDTGGGAVTVLDGVVHAVALLDSFITYRLELRDIRERERKTKAFENTDTPTVLPRGVFNGWGITVQAFGINTKFPLPPTPPLTGTWRLDASNRGVILVDTDLAGDEAMVTPAIRDALDHVGPYTAADPSILVHDRWKLYWRSKSLGGAYTLVDDIAHTHPSLGNLSGKPVFGVWEGRIFHIRINNVLSAATLPTNGLEIEFIIRYDGPTSEDWPYHLDGITVGELLRNGYRGDYSTTNPRIRYDETALLALATPVRMKLTAPVDDFRAWAETHAYPIVHAAPTLDAQGRISPITYLLPDATVTPVNLGNANCRPAGGGWSHGSEDAINVVRVTYERDYSVTSAEDAESDRVRSREVTVEHRIPDSIPLLGEQALEVKSELLRAIGNRDGGPIFGDVSSEIGFQVAQRVGRMATDRFALGGQYFALIGDRSDSDVEGLKPGSWVIVGVSWMPDYNTGLRGANRLAQVVGRREVDDAWTHLTLIDAGSANAPLGQPTLGTITIDSTTGVASIPVTALAAGSEARIDYAINATEPVPGSSLWTFIGERVDSVPTTLKTPPLPPGGTLWVRARGENVGARPSAYTTAVSTAVPGAAHVFDVELVIDEASGVPSVRWTPNSTALGMRLHYDEHVPTSSPTFPDTVDLDADDGAYTFASVSVLRGNAFSVRFEPWTGWTGSAVSGTAGPSVELTAERGVVRVQSGGIDINTATEQILVGAATGPMTGVGIFIGLNTGVYNFRVGNPAAQYLRWDGAALTVVGAITATTISASSGTVGGWTLSANDLSAGGAGGIRLNATDRRILLGAATAPLTGTGIFIGLDGSDWEFRVGTPGVRLLHWDGNALHLQGAIIQSPASTSDLSIQGWTHNLVFTSSDFDTVSWGSGTIVFPYGGTLNISPGGSTGNMAAPTFVYLDTGVSTTALQTTGVHSNAIGANKVLVAVCAPNPDSGKLAELQVFGGGFGVRGNRRIFANMIVANTITGNEILANTITATHVGSLSFSGKTAVFDTGSVGGWTMAAGTLSSGSVTISATAERILLGAASAPLTGTGIFIGKDGSDYEFRAGNPAGDFIHFDGTTFTIKTNTFTGSNPVFSGGVKVRAGTGVDLLEFLASGSDGQLVVRNASASSVFVVTGSSTAGTIAGSLDINISANGILRLGPAQPGKIRHGGGGTWGPSHVSGTASTVTGTTTETTLLTITTATETLGRGAQTDAFVFDIYGRVTGTGGTKTIRVKYAGTTIATYVLAASTVLDWWIRGVVVGTTGSTQRIATHFRTEGGSGALHQIDFGTGSVDYSATAGNITVTGQLGNTGDSIVTEVSHGEYTTHV